MRSGLKTKIYPTFRPDRALLVDDPDAFNPWVERLGRTADIDIASFSSFIDALGKRHQDFHDIGGRLSDHGLPHCHASPCTDREAASIFEKARAGRAAGPAEHEQFASYLMLLFGRLDAAEGLDQAAAPRGPAQREQPHGGEPRARHGLRLDR